MVIGINSRGRFKRFHVKHYAYRLNTYAFRRGLMGAYCMNIHLGIGNG